MVLSVSWTFSHHRLLGELKRQRECRNKGTFVSLAPAVCQAQVLGSLYQLSQGYDIPTPFPVCITASVCT